MASNRYNGLTEVGAGTIDQEQVRPSPSLDGASEYEYVTLMNPLPFKFVGKVAQSRPVNAPIRIVNGGERGIDENSLKQAGLDLRNADHPSNAHVTSLIQIESGSSINLRGDEAQVIVRQLVNELMSYEGHTLRIGNPAYRKAAEDRIIVGRKSIDELLGSPKSERELVDEALTKKNEEVAFPAMTATEAPGITVSEVIETKKKA